MALNCASTRKFVAESQWNFAIMERLQRIYSSKKKRLGNREDLVVDAPYCAIQNLQTYTLPVGLRAGLTGWVGDAYSEKVTRWLAGEGGTHPLVGHRLRPFFLDIQLVSN